MASGNASGFDAEAFQAYRNNQTLKDHCHQRPDAGETPLPCIDSNYDKMIQNRAGFLSLTQETTAETEAMLPRMLPVLPPIFPRQEGLAAPSAPCRYLRP